MWIGSLSTESFITFHNSFAVMKFDWIYFGLLANVILISYEEKQRAWDPTASISPCIIIIIIISSARPVVAKDI